MQKLVWSKTNLTGPAHFDGPLRPLPVESGFWRPIATLAFPAAPAGAPLLPGFASKIGLSREIQAGGQVSASFSNSFLHRAEIIDLTSKTDDQGHLVWDVPMGQWTVLRLASTITGTSNHPTAGEGSGLECDKLSRAAVDAHFAGMLGKLLADAGDGERRQAFTQTHIDSWEVGFQNWTPRFREEFRQRRGYDLTPYLPAFAGRIVESVEISDRFLWDVRRTIADLVAENYAGHLAELAHSNGLKLSIEAYGNGPLDDLMYAGQADVPTGEFWTETESGSRFNSCKAMASAAHIYGKPIVAAEAFTSYPATAKWQNHPFSLKAMADAAFCAGVTRLVIHRYAHQPWLDRSPGMTMGPYGVHYERTETWWEYSKPWHEYLARCQFLLRQGLFAADICYMLNEGAYVDPPTREQLVPGPPSGHNYDLASAEAVLNRMTVKDGRIVLADGLSYRVLVLPETELITPRLLRKIKQLVEEGATVIGPRPIHSPSLTDYPQCDSEVKQLARDLWGDCDGKTKNEHAVGKGKIVWGKPLAQVLAGLGATPDFEQLTKAVGHPLKAIHRELAGNSIYFVANSNAQPVYAECAFRSANVRPQLWFPDTGTIQKPACYRQQEGRTLLPLKLGPSGSVFVVFVQSPEDASLTNSGRFSLSPPAATARERGESEGERAGVRGPTDPIVRVTRNGKEDREAELSLDENGKINLLSSDSGRYEFKSASGKIFKTQIKALPAALELAGSWSVSFPTNCGAPDHVTFDKLISWPQHSNPGIKYFSGTATYRKNIQVPSDFLAANRRVYLNLGKVQVIAEVAVNDKKVGTLWKPPFELDITDFVTPGENGLTVKVVNLWPNRLIGDEHLPDDCTWRGSPGDMERSLAEWPKWLLEGKRSPTGRLTFTTWKHWAKDSPLLDSGLLGPVTLRVKESAIKE
jgi:hypothetical protein